MSFTFLESKKFAQIHIKGTNYFKNFSTAPFINEGSSIFKKPAFLGEGIILGTSEDRIAGAVRFKDENFEGYDGNQWVSLNKNEFWEGDERAVVCINKKIGINKNNPKKILDVGGDVSIDQKLFVKEVGYFENGLVIGESKSKAKEGTIRFYNNRFEGFNGESWIQFNSSIEENKNSLDEENINLLIEKKLERVGESNSNQILFTPEFVTGNNINGAIKYNYKEECFEFIKKNIKTNEFIDYEDIKLGKLVLTKNLDMNNMSIINLKSPYDPSDIVTKEYVDNICEGINNYYVVDFIVDNGITSNNKFGRNIISDVDRVAENDMFIILIEREYYIATVTELKIAESEEYILFSKEKKIEGNCKVFIRNGKCKNKELLFFKNLRSEKIEYQLLNKNEPISLPKFNNKCFIEEDNVISLREIKSDKENEVIKNNQLDIGCIGECNLQNNILKNCHFNPNIITEKEIAPESISEQLLKEKCIFEKHLTNESVSKDSLQRKIIYSMHLNDNIIDGKNIKKNAIKSEHIGSNQIKIEHFEKNCVSAEILQDKAVTEKKLGEQSINNNHLQSSCVTGYNIREKSIEAIHLVDNFIKEKHLGEKIIENKHIKNGSINTDKIKNSSITSDKIVDNIINSKHLNEKIIKNEHLNDKIIKEKNLVPSVIKSYHLSKGCIKTDSLCNGAVNEMILSDNSVSNSKIKSKTIDNSKLKNSFIKIDLDSNLTSNKIVNLGETLKITFNPNTYIPKRDESYVLLDENLKIGKEDNNNCLICYSNVEFEGDVIINGEIKYKKDFSLIGEIKIFLNSFKVNEDWLPCDGRVIYRENYIDFFNNLEIDEEIESYNLPQIENNKGMIYYIKVK